MRAIVFTGPPGSGKSTLARSLATTLGRASVDLDAEIERTAAASVSEVFAREGEPGFRARERVALETALREHPGAVIATGGGALMDPAERRAVLRSAWVLGLDAPRDELLERITRSGRPRPLLAADAGAQLDALLAARADRYAEVHASIDTRPPIEFVTATALLALDAVERDRVCVMPLGKRSYRVHQAALAALGDRVAALHASSMVTVTDARVLRAVGSRAGLQSLRPAGRVVLPGRGERDKTLASVRAIWDAALEARIDRDAVIIAIGGGVVIDLAGFAAATLLRGVRYASAPTTLMAMVDASVGGKTGFDHARGKNLVGAFHQPSLVVCDTSMLATLSLPQRRAGLAEVVKIALACDAELLARLQRDCEQIVGLDPERVAPLVPAAIQAKIDVVARDEREGGERALLNFGHTIGHAIERASGYRVPHGECVAVGMRAELALGVALGVTPPSVAREAHELLDGLAMPRTVTGRIDRAALDAALDVDKKRRRGALQFALCTGPGRAALVPVPARQARDAVRNVLEIRAARTRRLPSR